MIITRTPLRISFLGGGTDFEGFYKNNPGRVLSSAINKYIYICVHKHFDGKSFLLKYSKVEEGTNVEKIEHPLLREAMKFTGVLGVEITSMSDAPSIGTGLGSSSSFTVGLLNALYTYKGVKKTAEELAEDACKIEIEILKNPIGKQDQYIAAFGGLKQFVFLADGKVQAEEIKISKDNKRKFESNLLLFYTGNGRQAKDILQEQKNNIKEKNDSLLKVADFANLGKEFLEKGEFEKIGGLLNQNWSEKKQWAKNISNSQIDLYYQKAIEAGAEGGKICGAGGGGFFIFYCRKEKQESVRRALSDLQEVNFLLEDEGTKIIYEN